MGISLRCRKPSGWTAPTLCSERDQLSPSDFLFWKYELRYHNKYVQIVGRGTVGVELVRRGHDGSPGIRNIDDAKVANDRGENGRDMLRNEEMWKERLCAFERKSSWSLEL